MNLVVTAGPTREHLDPVRFLSNPSTGKMGFALAAEAARRGHAVTLVAGPVAQPTPEGVCRVDVVSACDMLSAVRTALSAACAAGPTVFISTAAVADWRPAQCAKTKLKKDRMDGLLRLVRNPDILKTVRRAFAKARAAGTLRLVGFAAETDHVLAEAARKCRAKGLDFIVANDVTEKGSGFGTDTNRVTFVFPDGALHRLPLQSKRLVARRILEQLEKEQA